MPKKKNLLRDMRILQREAIEKAEKELEGKDAEVFTSAETQSYINMLAAALTGRGKRSAIQTRIIYEPSDSSIGWTTNNVICINAGNPFIADYAALADRIMSVTGILYHEIAHCCYMDFTTVNEAIESIDKGLFYGKMPNTKGVDTGHMRAMTNAVSDKKYKNLFKTMFSGFHNIISDEHDEQCFIRDHDNYAEKCISKNKAKLGMSQPSFESMLENGGPETVSRLVSAASNMLLQYARFGYVLSKDPTAMNRHPIYQEIITPVTAVIESAVNPSANEEEICACCNELIFHMWKLIVRLKEKQENRQSAGNENSSGQSSQASGDGSGQGNQNSQSSSSSGNGSSSNGNDELSQEQIDEAVAALNQALSKLSTQAPDISKKADEQCKQAAGSAGNNESSGKNGSGMTEQEAENQAQKIAKQLVKRIVQANADESAVKAAAAELIELARDIGVSGTHRGVRLNVSRPLMEKNHGKSIYKKIAQEQKTTLNNMLRHMKAVFKDMQVGMTKKHQVIGNKFQPADAYRLDGTVFSNKKTYSEEPDIAVCVLVDESGSMYGERIISAQKTTVLLYDLCSALNIPCMICGHNTNRGTVFNIYSDFRSVEGDRYRVAAGISSEYVDGCNRDGHAIQIAGGYLKTRPEKVKLLMIISDGQPNADNYSGLAAEKDIKETVSGLSRQGVSTIAFAIGADKDRIKEIYGERYVDISDLNAMPKKLAGIVQREIKRSIL